MFLERISGLELVFGRGLAGALFLKRSLGLSTILTVRI